MPQKVTIVDYCGPQNNSRCGYCSQNDTCQSHGMWAHCMTAQDYQDLIDRGWRRSGQYCYKPNNKETCCPSYTIRCDALNFRLSKSNKKILKRFNLFLKNGSRAEREASDHDMKIDGIDVENDASDITEHMLATACRPTKAIDINQLLGSVTDATVASTTAPTTGECINNDLVHSNKLATVASDSTIGTSDSSEAHVQVNSNTTARSINNSRVVGPDPTKPLRKKAKLLRAERKIEKQHLAVDVRQQQQQQLAKLTASKERKNSNQEATLRSLIDSSATDGLHKLKVKLVPTAVASTEEAFNLYRRYQIAIHKDPPEKLTRKSFENFLTRSPLQVKLLNVNDNTFAVSISATYELYKKYQTIIHKDPPESISDFKDFLCHSPLKVEKLAGGPSCGYGSFHQQYWLDNRLIAVGVIDILPKCVSSVYFFYDPDYNFLSLGTYGTLREIRFVQELSKKANNLKDYYMGFYIDSCPKMRYKGKLQPSYLLCPEVYTWHLLSDDILTKLKASKYQRFNADNNAADMHFFNTERDLKEIRILIDYKYCIPFEQYKTTNNDDDIGEFTETLMEYGNLVGQQLSRRLYLCKN